MKIYTNKALGELSLAQWRATTISCHIQVVHRDEERLRYASLHPQKDHHLCSSITAPRVGHVWR